MATYNFFSLVLSDIDKKIQTCAVLCDMTQAFDCVDHDILLAKLYTYGIRGNVYNLLTYLISNLQQLKKII